MLTTGALMNLNYECKSETNPTQECCGFPLEHSSIFRMSSLKDFCEKSVCAVHLIGELVYHW